MNEYLAAAAGAYNTAVVFIRANPKTSLSIGAFVLVVAILVF